MRTRILGYLLPALLLAVLPVAASAGMFIGVSVDVPPPPLPVYVQPPCPQPGFIWVPGYWAWGPYGYYWVPGTWVLPPQVGLLWTPGYWGWDDGAYLWHTGYWGPRVGFYGGIDYGFGYDGDGFYGGYWRGGIFFYNRAVLRVGPGFDDDYYHPVPRPVYYHRDFDHVSYNGGPHGIMAHPTREDLFAAREHHFAMTPEQRQHVFMARGDRVLRANFNHGRPPIAATARPTLFHGRGVLAARAAGGPMVRRGPQPRFAPHPADRPAWAAARRDTGPHPGPQRFNAAPHPWAGPRAMQRPRPGIYRQPPAPRMQYRPAPHFQARPAPRMQYRPAPRFQPRPAPQMQYRAAPQYRPVPQFRRAPQYHPVPQYHPAPQYHPGPQFHPAPRGRPHPGPRRPPRWR